MKSHTQFKVSQGKGDSSPKMPYYFFFKLSDIQASTELIQVCSLGIGGSKKMTQSY